MPQVIFIDAQDNQFEADIEVGHTVMEGAVDHMIDGILGECGGVLACATCHCYVDPAWQDKLPPVSEAEADMIEAAVEPKANSRLSCQIEMTEALDGLVVRLPRSQY
ncbi:2Fe-2S iron-sulfur cluster-binding protein [Idiomarina xiamenensis]|uniref:Ferredoxin n=1 Tax=Idiomarina xiamenensis 10-D-4 TaxID=740709 RepID=K2JN07_9GAMM|nr:2Fe-2S iron-sulfur cluster-binding protein [Idiomarina xiamenensis]EKE84901.1 ferredoxin [Idiomarina xiamenensis 10-D-4]